MEKRYNKLNEYYKEKFGERTLKICVDGGFTCPNRDGKKAFGGCIFCSQKGSGELIKNTGTIENQVKSYLNSYRATRANKFIVYFQNYTNTYDSIENLKKKYDSSLIDDRIIGISIGTRPDCITKEIAKLLSTYTNKYNVCVELGLQTVNDTISKLINLQYTSTDFTNAVKILNKYNIDVVAHIMVGLPNETVQDIKDTVNFINKHKIHGIKIHSTYIVQNTVLADMYKNHEYKALDIDDYVETLIDILTHLKPNLIIHRIVGDSPKDILIAPEWNKHKLFCIHEFEKRFKARNLWQGKFYNKNEIWK